MFLFLFINIRCIGILENIILGMVFSFLVLIKRNQIYLPGSFFVFFFSTDVVDFFAFFFFLSTVVVDFFLSNSFSISNLMSSLVGNTTVWSKSLLSSCGSLVNLLFKYAICF